MGQLDGKIALVTGAGQGVGQTGVDDCSDEGIKTTIVNGNVDDAGVAGHIT